MAIGVLTMILTNVGLSIFNNWANGRQNQQIAEKREAFERAVCEGQHERMLQLMREGQQLTLELEEQKHQERLKELNKQFDNLIQELAYSATIDHWPLTTLPIVMKNQAMGNLLANQQERVALHCILTSSNCPNFNQHVMPKLEDALETFCNIQWSSLSGSPILFYSGAWKTNDIPTGTQVDSMRAALGNLPTVLISPFFRPQDHKLVFLVYVWGVWYRESDQFTIPLIDPTDFRHTYTDELAWSTEKGLVDNAIGDIVPFLQCLIGFIADTYFWSAFGLAPRLPRMLSEGVVNADGAKSYRNDGLEYYTQMLEVSEKNVEDNPFAKNNLIALFDGFSSLLGDEELKNGLRRLFLHYCTTNKNATGDDLPTLINETQWSLCDLHFVSMVVSFADEHNISEYQELKPIVDMLTSIDYDYSILDVKDLTKLEEWADAGNAVALYRLGEIYEYGMRVPVDDEKACQYYQQSAQKGFLFGKLKMGVIRYEDIPPKAEAILRSMNILQLDVLFSDEVVNQIRTDCTVDEVIERLSQVIMSNMMTGRAYCHAGLLYNLAVLKMKNHDYQTARSMADLAVKLGYKKAMNLPNV